MKPSLAVLTNLELAALEQAAGRASPIAPALQIYIALACEWECGRRAGEVQSLPTPVAVIPYHDLGATFASLALMLVAFESEPHLRRFIQAIGDELDASAPSPTWH